MNYPEAFLDNMRTLLGGEYEAFAAALDREARAALRVNPLKKDALRHALKYADGPVPWESNGYYVKAGTQPGKSAAHHAGLIYMQDASAMAPVNALDPQPGERILDLCAAPGGKSGQIAARLNGRGVLVSNEIDRSRAKVLSGNLERLGVTNAYVMNETAARLSKRFFGWFDRILVDAPCSGEGMFRRDEAARAEWNENSPAGCARRQAEILDEAAKMLKPGGTLVYSTCTFNRTENEDSVRNFLERTPGFAPKDFSLEGVGQSTNGTLRLWPHRIGGEGHFVACLTRTDDCRTAAFDSVRATGEGFRKAVLNDLCRALPDGKLMLYGERLMLLPETEADISGLNCLRAGLVLGEAGRGFVKPDHALAMVLPAEAAANTASLSDEDALKYMAGEAVPVSGGKGWTLVLTDGMPLGWGKISDGILKNHLPKGLRRESGYTL